MPLHIIKLCAGATSIEDLRARVDATVARNIDAGFGARHECVTRMRPKKEGALLDGGSLYWVIGGNILARQQILALEPREGADGVRRVAIILNREIVPTMAQPRRAFQGWRYLTAEDAPADIIAGGAGAAAPPELMAALSDLGLL